MQNRVLRAVLLCLSFVAIAACTKKGQDVEVQLPDGTSIKAANNETLRVKLTTEPPTLDWSKSSDTTSAQVQMNIMDGLVEYDFTDKELGLKPALALKWVSSNNARTWKFTLRQGVKWSDGVEFTAQHVIDGWKRLLDPATASQYAYSMFGIKNAEEFSQGKIKDFSKVGVSAPTPYELVVELKQSMSYFPYLLTHHAAFPLRLDVIQKYGDKWTEAGKIVTLGAFTLAAWQHDNQILLQRNESYYGEKPTIKYVMMYMILEQATALNLFDSGKLDAITKLPSAELRNLKNRKEYRELGILQLYYYGMNTKVPPTNNVNVRKAIAHAIDKRLVVQMLGGGEIPMSSWIPSGMFGYEADRGLTFDPVKAKELLKQAGYADPSKFPKITIGFNTNENHQRIAENIQAQLKANLGINIELKNEEWKVYLNSLITGTYPVFRFGWLADYPDPHNFFSLITSNSDNNKTFWKNSEFDKLVAKGASEPDKNKRREIYSRAQQILVEEEVPVIPILGSVNNALVSSRVENFPLNAMDQYIYKGVRLK